MKSLAVTLILTLAFACAAHGEVNREALFRRAFTSAPYIISVAGLDSDFAKTLTVDEQKMMRGIFAIARDARNREWAREEGITITPAQKAGESDRFFYVFTGSRAGGEERWQSVVLKTNFGLRFSDDASLFQLNKDQSPRSAVTSESLTAPIYMNRAIVNHPSLQLKLPEALQILIHELGHKLGAAKNQNAVDSFAAKLKSFVESKAAEFPTSKGKITAYKLNSDIFHDWMETSLQGRYQGANIPNEVEPFAAFNREGIYILAQTENRVQDLTRSVIDDWVERHKNQVNQSAGYEWRHFHFFKSYSLSVRETSPGLVRIEINAEHAETPIPFHRIGSPDPRSEQPWRRIFDGGEAGQLHNQRAEWNFELTTNGAKKINYWSRPLVFETSKTTAKKLLVSREGEDLVFRFEVPERIAVQGSDLSAVRAFLIASLDRQPFEIEGVRDHSNPNLVTFRIPKADSSLQGELQTLNIEVEPQVRNLARPYYVRSRLFLDQSDKIKLMGRAPEPVVVTNLQHTANDVHLTLQSADEILGVQLEVRVQPFETVTTKNSVGAETQVVASGRHELPAQTHSIVVPRSSMKQVRANGLLHVSLNLADGFDTKNKWTVDLTPPDLPGWANQLGGMRMIEEHFTELKPERKILGLQILDGSARTLRYSSVTQKSFACRSAF